MSTPPTYGVPTPDLRRPRRWQISAVWLVPLVAGLVGLGLVVRSVLLAGPTITISFANAQGLAQGTEVKYKNVVVGRVSNIHLSKNLTNVLVTVELNRSATALAVQDTRFWVVRPRINWGGVSGLYTLLSGAYIGVDVGTSKNARSHFKGLNEPPAITHEQRGNRFVLHSADVGSLNIGSSVYYRGVPVGRVVRTRLSGDGRRAILEVFVKAPYDQFVTRKTRFWNVSGVNLSLTASGFELDTQSLLTVLVGGVAFGRPAREEDVTSDAPPAPDGTIFRLYSDKNKAMAPPSGTPELVQMKFHRSIRGLKPGAEVDFLGVDFGHVVSIKMHYDPVDRRFWTDVLAEIYPHRLGPAFNTLRHSGQASDRGKVLGALIKRGLRAQLRTGNLITGQLYVALDFFPDSSPARFDPSQFPPVIPTIRGRLGQVQAQIAEIVRKLDAIPYHKITRDLGRTMNNANAVLAQIDTQLAPKARVMLEQAQRTLASANRSLVSHNAPLQQSARQTLDQVRRAARAIRSLAEYLERHPEALIRGKRADAPPTTPSGSGS